MSQILNGKEISLALQDKLKEQVSQWQKEGHRSPTLSVVLVGDDPASQVYVGHKKKACLRLGIDSKVYHLGAQSTQEEVEDLVESLNQDPQVDGILVQLPLPQALDSFSVIEKIHPQKDVDGLTSQNQGLLSLNKPCHHPCTPSGIIKLLQATQVPLQGLTACVIGRSTLVGSPITKLLIHHNLTVTQVHSRTKDPQSWTRQAQVLVVAAGKHHLVDESWVKPDSIIIDVGIHRINNKLQGDVNFDSVAPKASFITPVPGGVGPMTIACLMENTLRSYERSL